jgi:hypothetical protein
MAYRKFSERSQNTHETLGGLAALGAHHPQILGREIETITPAKVAKAPKVLPLSTGEQFSGFGKSTCTPPKAPKAPKVTGTLAEAMAEAVCAQCGGGLSTEPSTDAPSIMVYDGRLEIWLHPECRRFWWNDHMRKEK